MANYIDQEEEQPRKIIRSLRSDTFSLVTFINRTQRPVRLFWIDFKGQRVQYAILRGSEPFPVTTYVTHPWVCRDAQTGDRLSTDKQDVYFPEAWDGGPSKLVNIDVPVYTLRERCLQIIRDIHKDALKDQLQHMEIPEVLKLDLLKKENIPYKIRVQVV